MTFAFCSVSFRVIPPQIQEQTVPYRTQTARRCWVVLTYLVPKFAYTLTSISPRDDNVLTIHTYVDNVVTNRRVGRVLCTAAAAPKYYTYINTTP